MLRSFKHSWWEWLHSASMSEVHFCFVSCRLLVRFRHAGSMAALHKIQLLTELKSSLESLLSPHLKEKKLY